MKKIVIADDNKILLEQIKKGLSENEEIEIIGTAQNGIEELELIEKLNPDIAVTDIEMPEMTGIEVIEQTEKIGSTTEFIVITGAITSNEILKKLSSLSIRNIIYKPFDIKQVIDDILKESEVINTNEGKETDIKIITNEKVGFIDKIKRLLRKLKKKQ